MTNTLFGIKSHAELYSIFKQIWIPLITYYNSYVWNKILNHTIEFNYTVWNNCGNKLD
jgi:hypothetical protein